MYDGPGGLSSSLTKSVCVVVKGVGQSGVQSECVSDDTTERFVFRTRGSPSCASECVKIQCPIKDVTWMCVKTSFLDDIQTPKP